MKPVIRSLRTAGERKVAISQLAALRIQIFREWPYLYDGTADYEEAYLHEFAQEPGSVLVIAEHEGNIVGAATASPITGQKAEFREAVQARGLNVEQLFYFGESVLLPAYRGLGLGHAFFDAREAAARAAGAKIASFCAVVRPEGHQLKPPATRDLAPFWRSRGYAPVEGLVCNLDWKDVDQPEETSHLMQFWMREL
jgi:GNAT superfamily N-acetyltransferase